MTEPLNIGLLASAMRGFNAIDGGIAGNVADLAAALADEGHRVRVFVVAENNPARFPGDTPRRFSVVSANARLPNWWNRLSFWNWQLHSLGGLFYRSGVARRTLAAAHQDEPLDVVETSSTGLLGLRCLRGRNRPRVVVRVSTTASQLVAHNRANSRWIERVESRLERRLAVRSDQIVTHTRGHRDEIGRLWRLDPRGSPWCRSNCPAPAAEIEGRALARPGQYSLCRSLRAPQRHPHPAGGDTRRAEGRSQGGIHPRRAGSPRDRQAGARRRAGRFDPRRVEFANQVGAAGLQAAYRDCDIFVAPSLYESFGLIYAEAMGWEKPAVGCRVGGVPEVVADGETGLLVPPGDTAALVQALLRLSGDAGLRRRLGIAGRQRVERLFSLSAMARASTALYREVIARGRRT